MTLKFQPKIVQTINEVAVYMQFDWNSISFEITDKQQKSNINTNVIILSLIAMRFLLKKDVVKQCILYLLYT